MYVKTMMLCSENPNTNETLPCVSFYTGYFVMVPLNMTYLHCLQHSLFEHLFNLYYLFCIGYHKCHILNTVYDFIDVFVGMIS